MRDSDFLLFHHAAHHRFHLCAYLRCPHRIYRDAFDDPTDKDPPNECVQMLWEQGTQYEAAIIAAMRGDKELLDLSAVPAGERAAATLKALSASVPLSRQQVTMELPWELSARPHFLPQENAIDRVITADLPVRYDPFVFLAVSVGFMVIFGATQYVAFRRLRNIKPTNYLK